MPKTSVTQFEMMVDFMERNGDLSKQTTEGPSGRLTSIRRWEEITNILNADATGDTKNTDKWRKVWSDLKNNTKRKKARILQSASGTGGGPASKIKLTDLEDRVLNIIGPQAATGIPEVPEIGLNQEMIPVAGPSQLLPLSPPPGQETSEIFIEEWPQLVVGSLHEPDGSPHEQVASLHGPAGSPHEPVASPQTPTSRRHITLRGRLTPRRRRRFDQPNESSPMRRARLQAETDYARPEFLESGRERGRLSPRRRRHEQLNRTSPVPRRRARPQTQSERARQEFLESDRQWRAFFMNREQEAHRVREMELKQQARWQELFETFLVTCNTAIEVVKNKNK